MLVWNAKKFVTNMILLAGVIILCYATVETLPGAIDAQIERMPVHQEVLYDKSEVMPDGLRDRTTTENQDSNVTGSPKEVMPSERTSACTGDDGTAANVTPPILMEATAYSYECGTGDGLTATMTPIRDSVVAVDPDTIPLNSTVEIVGMGVYHAEDVGGAIKGNRIDIFMPSRGDCVRFGRQSVEVRVLEGNQ